MRVKAVKVRPDERFARLLELSSSSSVVDDPAMASLIGIASALRVAGQAPGLPIPDPDFRAALRQRLVAVATVQEPAVAKRQRSLADLGYRARRRLATVAAGITVATSVAGVGVAAAHSLPGDPFYGVKKATEAVQLWATFGDEAKGKRHLEFARERLAEVKALPRTSSHIPSTFAAMDSQTTQGTSELLASYRSSHSTTPLADLLIFSRQQIADLQRLAPTLPPAARVAETRSLAIVTGVAAQVHRAAPGVCVLCQNNNGIVPNVHSTSPTPSPQHSSHPSTQPSNHPSQSPTGGTSLPSTSGPSGGPSVPTQLPTTHLPTHVPTHLPTQLPTHLPTKVPTSGLNSLLHHTPNPVVSSILGGLGH